MVLRRDVVIGLVVVPIGLGILFMLLVAYYSTRRILCEILICFWKKKHCLCCKHKSCRKKQMENCVITIETADDQPLECKNDSETTKCKTLRDCAGLKKECDCENCENLK